MSNPQVETDVLWDQGYAFLQEADPECTPKFDDVEASRGYVIRRVFELYDDLPQDVDDCLGESEEPLDLVKLQTNHPRYRWIRILTRLNVKEVFEAGGSFPEVMEFKAIDAIEPSLEQNLQTRALKLFQICEAEGRRRINPAWIMGEKGNRRANDLYLWISKQPNKDALWFRLQEMCLEKGIELVRGNDEIPRTPEMQLEFLEKSLLKRLDSLVQACKLAGVKKITPTWMKHQRGGDFSPSSTYLWIQRQEDSEYLWGKLTDYLAKKKVTVERPGTPEIKPPEQRIKELVTRLAGFSQEWTPEAVWKTMPVGTQAVLFEKYGSANGLRWAEILDLLPEKKRNLFYYHHPRRAVLEEYPREKELYISSRMGRVLRHLTVLLTQENPENFDEEWLKKNGFQIISMVKSIREVGGTFDWTKMLNAVGSGWAERFRSA